MSKETPTRWNQWLSDNGGIVLLIGLVIIVVVASLIMRQLVPR